MKEDEVKTALAHAVMLNKFVQGAKNVMSDNIAQTLSLIANYDPEEALEIIEQLQEQLTKEQVKALVKQKEDQMERIKQAIKL